MGRTLALALALTLRSSPSPSASASASASSPPPSSPTPTPTPNPNPIPTPTPAFIATRGLVLIPAPPLSRCDADREVLRQLWGGGVRVLPVLTKTDLLDQVILRGALVRGRSHLLVAVVVKLPCSTGQQKDAATLARVTPLSLRAHPSRLPTCPVHILPAPCTWLHGGVQMFTPPSCHPPSCRARRN